MTATTARKMLLPHSIGVNVLARSLLCAASHQAVLLCTLPPRCSPKRSTRVHCQGVHTGSILQCAGQHWWPAQRKIWRHSVPQGVTACDVAQRNTENIIKKHAYSTNKTDRLDQASDMTEKEETDLKALIELELELYRQEGFPVPSEISSSQWQELLTKGTVSARKKYLTFLFKNEMKRQNKRKLKENIRKQKEEEERQKEENPVDEDGHIEYGLWKNSIFIKILETSMNQYYHTRVVQAMLHGQPLIIDLDFEDHMSSKERQNCAYQIQMMMSANRKHEDPYSLEIHNAPPTLDTMARLERYVPPLYKPEYPLIINPKSYLKKYPKEQLVYLTPHCQEELLVYDHNAVYIVGGIVDKSSGEPLTLAKAKKEGVRMQKLPLDRYLTWGIGNKCLTLNQIMNIMLDFKMTGDWPHALRHVPRRKLQSPPWNLQTKEEVLLKKIQWRQRQGPSKGADVWNRNRSPLSGICYYPELPSPGPSISHTHNHPATPLPLPTPSPVPSSALPLPFSHTLTPQPRQDISMVADFSGEEELKATFSLVPTTSCCVYIRPTTPYTVYVPFFVPDYTFNVLSYIVFLPI